MRNIDWTSSVLPLFSISKTSNILNQGFHSDFHMF